MAICRKCKQPIKFKKLKSGKWCPTNLDGSDHWDDCREITNRYCTKPKTQDYGTITGINYIKYTGDETIPPWDDDSVEIPDDIKTAIQHMSQI